MKCSAATGLITGFVVGGTGAESALASLFSAVGAFALPTTSADDAVTTTLDPGAYTIIITGGGTGVALLEVYQVP